jgi:HAE1 family hydrophobic/amphiphilic exporter-1
MEKTDPAGRAAEALLKERPEVERYMVNVGAFSGGLANEASIMVKMKDPDKRTAAAPFTVRPTQQQFMAFIREQFAKIPGMKRASVLDLSLMGFSSRAGYPVEFSVQGPDWARLSELSRMMMEGMRKTGLVTDINTDYKPGMPEIKLIPDRERAAAQGVTISNITSTISATVSSLSIGKYTDDSGRRNDIRVSLQKEYRRDQSDISSIRLRNMQGEMVPLSNVVRLHEEPTLMSITRYNRERAISIFANIAQGKSQADALAMVASLSAGILPEGYHIVFSGSSQAFHESFNSLIFALFMGVIVAYMVLASQFNSFLHPVIILLALPFSVTGAFIAMRITGMSLNIYSMIGLLLLMGIVKKNSILLVDFTNQRRVYQGMNVREALLDACPIRLRPIIMTSLATVAAAIPPAFSMGAGSETVRPMAIVVIGGVILSTLLTLFIVPCAYSLMSRFESARHRKELREALVSLGEIKK